MGFEIPCEDPKAGDHLFDEDYDRCTLIEDGFVCVDCCGHRREEHND